MSFIPQDMDINKQKGQIMQLVQTRGPVLPMDIAKATGVNSIFAGALLAELLGNKQIRVSNAKIGGSPVYYLKGQENRLEMLYKYLHEKERKAFDLLKTKNILKDSDMSPVERVSLRSIKDFAVMLDVKLNGENHVFWKWHLLRDEESTDLIKQYLGIEEKKPEPKEEIKKEQPKEDIKREEPKKEIEKPAEEKITLPPKKIIPEKPKTVKKPIKEESQKKLSAIKTTADDEFLATIKNHLEDNKVIILEHKAVRKNSEHEMVVKIPSQIGTLTYFCVAKNKKRCNEGDLSSAYIKGQMKKLPTLFVTTGDITKAAKTMLESEFKSMKMLKME